MLAGNLIKGLTILGGQGVISAEHDIIYVTSTNDIDDFDLETVDLLDDLGFHWDYDDQWWYAFV